MAATKTKPAGDFSSLIFNDRGGSRPMGEQATAFYPNGYGVSVVRGPLSYGGPEGLYELAVLKGSDVENFELTYETPITDDVEGHLTPERVSALMARVQQLPKVEAA